MEDKAPVPTDYDPESARIKHGIASFPWPASLSDMNPIEEVWRRMKDFLYQSYVLQWKTRGEVLQTGKFAKLLILCPLEFKR